MSLLLPIIFTVLHIIVIPLFINISLKSFKPIVVFIILVDVRIRCSIRDNYQGQ